METYPERKHPRLKAYDYASAGFYFVTICTQGRVRLFGDETVGRDLCVPPCAAYEIAERRIRALEEKFPTCSVDHFAIMPNHVHLLLRLREPAAGHMGPALPEIVQWYKTMTTNDCIRAVKAGRMERFAGRVWQTSFYEEVIRDEAHYLSVWRYIDENPLRWREDVYFDG